MTNLHQIYKCPICGNVVEVLHAGSGQLVCCGQPMELLNPKVEDVGFEKHLPVVEQLGNTVTVKIGSIPHPMEDGHYIEWIEVITDNQVYKKFLKPNEEAIAIFEITDVINQVRCYCNLHGLWQK
jgi:superoxide reductase